MPRRGTHTAQPYFKPRGLGVRVERSPNPRDKLIRVRISGPDVRRRRFMERPKKLRENSRSRGGQDDSAAISSPHEFDATTVDTAPSDKHPRDYSHRAPGELTGQAAYTVNMTFRPDPSNEANLSNEPVRVCRVIGPFSATPQVLEIVCNPPKNRSGKFTLCVTRNDVAGGGDQLGDQSTPAEPGVFDGGKQKVIVDLEKN